MALIRVRVDPPTPVKPPYGLLDVAQVVEDTTPHWRTGVEYDTVNCHEAKVWGEWCVGAGQPVPTITTRTVAVTLTGTRAATGDVGDIDVQVNVVGYSATAVWDANDYSYGLSALATVDGGPDRQIKISLETGTHDYDNVITTGGAVTPVTTDLVDEIHGVATITDVLTGVAINVPVRQNADGTLEEPVAPIIIAVPEAGIPQGCFGITTVLTAAPGETAGTATVSATVTTTSAEARDVIIYIDGHRTPVTTGSGATEVVQGLAPGFYKVGIRDIKSWSYVTGWIYISDEFTGSATFIQPTCPVKDIISPPWQTLDADPFTVYAEVICKAVAFPEAERSAREALESGQQRAVERHYWDSLIERAQAVAGGQPVQITRAVASMEQYIASAYNGVGTIHVSPWGIEYLAMANLLDSSRWRGRYGNAQSGELLRTWRGTPIVVGHGYPREAGPIAATGDDFWMFITGQVMVRHSDINAVETFNQRTNDKTAVAERTFVVIDDCPIPGVVHVSPQEVW